MGYFGASIFDDIPPGDGECEEEITFELWEVPPPSTYIIDGCDGLYCLINDVTKIAGRSRDALLRHYSDIQTLELTPEQFGQRSTCLQICEAKTIKTKTLLVKISGSIAELLTPQTLTLDVL